MTILTKLKEAVALANPQKQMARMMALPKDERGSKLRGLALKYGCSLESTYGGDGSKHLESEVIRRIQEAGRSYREAMLWCVAVISAIAAALSALAAWCAVLLS